MAFVSEVTAKLNVDKTGVERDITQVVSSFGKAGQAIDKQFSKGFGFKKLAKSLLGGFGFASASDLKEIITKPFQDAAEAAKRIEESTAETAKIYEKIFSSRRTDQQNLEFNQRQQARLQRELAEVTKPKLETVKGIFNPFTGKSEDVQRQISGPNMERAAEIQKELAELSSEENTLRQKMGKEQKALDEEKMRNADAFSKKQYELDQQVEDFLRSEMSIEDQIKRIEAERMDIAERMAISDEDTLDLQKRELELQQRITQLEKQQADAAKRKAEQANRIAKQLVEAGRDVEKARADYQTELRDRSGMTLAEVAGQRTNYSARVTARNIQKLEEQAKRVRLIGGQFRDESGRVTSKEEYADRLISRADKMRLGLGMLTSKEQDPMKDAAEAIKKSEEHLASIDTKLTPEEIE
jgi:hypothetical protein